MAQPVARMETATFQKNPEGRGYFVDVGIDGR